MSHLLLLFTTVMCNYSRIYNSVLQKFTEKRSKEGDMHRTKIAVYCDPQKNKKMDVSSVDSSGSSGSSTSSSSSSSTGTR